MTTAISVISNFENIQSISKVFADSGMFTDVKGAAQVAVKIMAGAELGLPPFTSMQAFHIIQGKPAMSANSIAARIKTNQRYNYRVIVSTSDKCEIAFFERDQQVHVETWTRERAAKAGVKNMDKYPEAMLFSRAITAGARKVCPEVIGAFYASEELGASVDELGNLVVETSQSDQTGATPPQPEDRTALKDRIIALGNQAKAKLAAARDSDEAARLGAAISAARDVYAKNGSATIDELKDTIATLEAALA